MQIPFDAVVTSGHKLDALRLELDQYLFLLLQLQILQVAPQPL